MDENTDLISAKIEIAGRLYPIKAKEAELEGIRAVANEVNEKVRSFQRAYPSKDKQDCLAMALLTYAVDRSMPADEEPKLRDQLAKAHKLLDSLIHP